MTRLEAARAGQHTNEHLYQVREACTQIEDRLIEERQQFYSRSYETDEEDALLDGRATFAPASARPSAMLPPRTP